jgi:hypothetical protein
MLRNLIGVVLIAFGVTTLSLGAKLGMFKTEGDKLIKKADVSFIDFEVRQKTIGEKIDGKQLVVYYGRITWNEQSGAYGQPANVPVQILRPLAPKKQLISMAQYFPSSDGKFYFAVEKVESDYILAVFPQRAEPSSLPQKVREFFEGGEVKDGNHRQGKGNPVH